MGWFSTQANPLVSDQFITGGEQGMRNYAMTEHWERLDRNNEEVHYQKSKPQGLDNMWLNLTCYVNPSPWLLQWANSVWIQNAAMISGRYRSYQSAGSVAFVSRWSLFWLQPNHVNSSFPLPIYTTMIQYTEKPEPVWLIRWPTMISCPYQWWWPTTLERFLETLLQLYNAEWRAKMDD